ncbi:MAG: calmodulin [Pseudomonadota bacterium]
MKKLLSVFAITLFAGSTAFAQVAFEEVDADADGLVTAAEAEAVGIPAETFTAADTDADGALNADEFATIPQ